MALTATKNLMSGIALTYHRIIAVSINYDQNRVEAVFGSYISEEARRAGKIPVETVQIGMAINGETIADPRVWLYEKAMAPMRPEQPHVDATDTTPMSPYMPPMPANEVAGTFMDAVAS